MDNVNEKARQSAEMAKKLPPSVQYAIAKVVPNMLVGAFWGFTELEDAKNHIEAVKDDKNIMIKPLSDAALIEVNPNYLLKAVQAIDANAITKADIEIMQKNMAQAKVDFEKFLIGRGKKPEGYAGTIGIYCTNKVTTINYNDVAYPAFRISLNDCLQLLYVYGYAVQVAKQFIDPREAAQSGVKMWKSMKLSPTNTGIFMNIKYMGTPEGMKQKEKEYKAKYGIK